MTPPWQFGSGAAVQTDDRMALEFSAPRALHTAARRDNVVRLRALADPSATSRCGRRAWEGGWRRELAQRAVMLRRAGVYEPAYDAALDAHQRTPIAPMRLPVLVEAAVATGRQARGGTASVATIVRQHPDLVAPRVALSKLRAASGAFDEAIRVATEAVQQHPDDAGEALEQLASIYADVGDVERLGPLVTTLARFPQRAGSRYYIAANHFIRGELGPAQTAARDALSIDPRFARAQNLLGAIYATRGDTGNPPVRRSKPRSLSIRRIRRRTRIWRCSN